MTETAYEDGRWLLCADDLEVLEDLKEYIWTWRKLCRSAMEMLALGGGVYAIEQILDGGEPGSAVQVSVSNVTIAADDPADLDGISLDFEVGDEGIVLSETRFVGTGQGLSRDHHSRRRAILTDRGGFYVSAIREWIEEAESVFRGGAEFQSNIAALPEF